MNRSYAYYDADLDQSYTVRAILIGLLVGSFIGVLIAVA